ncbi:MAG: site-specific integrase [Acidobacteria bacterium]|nr:site-specific integrase [Acidobacteriota bacterium]
MSRTLSSPVGATISHFTPASTHQTAKQLTYSELIEYHLGTVSLELEDKGYSAKVSHQIVRNHRTAINGWMRHKDVDAQTPVGDELGCEFNGQLTAHLKHLRHQGGIRGRGLSESTLHSRESLLNRWRDSWLKLINTQGLPSAFNEALSFLIRGGSHNLFSIARDTGVPRTSLSQWMAGARPSALQVDNIQRLETYFDLPPATLLSRAGLAKTQPRPYRAGATTDRRRLQKLTVRKYRLTDFSSLTHLQDEWNGLEQFMSMPCPPEGMRRNSRWNEDPSTQINSTAVRQKELLASYFGFLCLPTDDSDPLFKGEGLNAQSLSLALLTNTTLVERFIEFRRLRAGGVYTSETIQVLSFCCSLLREETGYLRQHPEFGERLQPAVTCGDWDMLCKSSHRRFTALRNSLCKEKAIGVGRDVEEPIRAILDRQHPIQALFELIAAAEAAPPSPNENPGAFAIHHRNLLLIRMLSAIPLRIKHYSIMTYRPDNSGNLYQKRDGSWWLWFHSRTFKNFKHLGAATHDYRVPLPKSLWSHIECYLSEHRPHLLGAQECDYVFRPSVTMGAPASKIRPTARIKQRYLSRTVLRLTQRHLPESAGFGPHAFRHILATDYIKNRPDGFEVAARLLHDKIETVRRAYAHLRTADYIAHWLVYYEEQQREAQQ